MPSISRQNYQLMRTGRRRDYDISESRVSEIEVRAGSQKTVGPDLGLW